MKKIVVLSLILGIAICFISYGIHQASEKKEKPMDFNKYEGKYITGNVDIFSSFLPELELTKEGRFTLAIGITSDLKGDYAVEDDWIALYPTENTSAFPDRKVKKISLMIQDTNTLILPKGLQEVIKPAAAFKKSMTATTPDQEPDIETINVRGSKDGVETFLTLLEQEAGESSTMTGEVLYDSWYNVTPEEVFEKTGGQIFKSSETCASFFLYEGGLYRLEEWFGGLGIVDIKVCDLDQDGEYELLYTYSWGSGLHRSHVGHFDLKTKKQTELGFVHLNEDMMLAENPDGSFSLYEARIEWGEVALIDFDLIARRHLGDVIYKDGELSMIENSKE